MHLPLCADTARDPETVTAPPAGSTSISKLGSFCPMLSAAVCLTPAVCCSCWMRALPSWSCHPWPARTSMVRRHASTHQPSVDAWVCMHPCCQHTAPHARSTSTTARTRTCWLQLVCQDTSQCPAHRCSCSNTQLHHMTCTVTAKPGLTQPYPAASRATQLPMSACIIGS